MWRIGMTNESVSSQERNPLYGNTVTLMAGLWGPALVALEKNLIRSLSQTHIKPSRFFTEWILPFLALWGGMTCL